VHRFRQSQYDMNPTLQDILRKAIYPYCRACGRELQGVKWMSELKADPEEKVTTHRQYTYRARLDETMA
jgi:ribosomal protein L34E